MKFNKWTMGLAAVGVVSLASAARADEMKMSQVQTALSNTTLSGYVDTSAMWNLGSQNGGALPPYTPGGVTGDGFNLNAVDIALDKPMDEGNWASGYHVELMYGPDAIAANASAPNVRQAYLTLRTPVASSEIDWKVGVFDTIIGYESSSDPQNPNYTRSYGWNLEPTSHTGIVGTFKVNSSFSITAGVANSSTGNAVNGDNATTVTPVAYESQKTYLGAIALTAPDSWGWAKGATLNAGVIVADNGSASTTSAGRTWLYVGATVPTPMTALKVGAAFDYKDYHDSPINAATATVNPANNSIWAAGLYANYQANEKLSFNARGEYVDPNAVGGSSIEELTATVQYSLWGPSVLSRLELRWDHSASDAYDSATGAGSGAPIHKNEVLLALNLIYQF
jgi:hypothetical protein